MNVKLCINEVVRLIDNRVPTELIYKQLAPLARQVRLELPMPQTGVDYLQWSLPGDDWMSFSQVSEEQKPVIAKLYQQRREQMVTACKASPLIEAALTIPSESFLYFRKNGMDYDISLVAWGYKYPYQVPCMELDTWIKKEISQKVCIGFKWDDQLLENYQFYLDNFDRRTSVDGWFYVDKPLPVGNEHAVKTTSGVLFTLKVEQGKEEYIFDLTQYAFVDVAVQKDRVALKNCSCEVLFNGRRYQLVTDEAGTASLKLPLVCTPLGKLLQPQSVCQVMCQSERQEQAPYSDGDRLAFHFSFLSEKPKEPEPFKPFEEKPETIMPSPKELSEPQFVEIKLLDYGGYPLPNLDFTLVTKKKGGVQLKTDANGICNILQEWFTGKEKFQIKFDISPEYQKTHDLHDVKNEKKYGQTQ